MHRTSALPFNGTTLKRPLHGMNAEFADDSIAQSKVSNIETCEKGKIPHMWCVFGYAVQLHLSSCVVPSMCEATNWTVFSLIELDGK